ncbi:GNAT family N-acetyltransferase [Nocardioides sp. JQ2195]|uniref:GNAT family N-acetyltransferase n=1 Tax=Nocardioides sp. JQ2195 TaxID=2592334 RepID=UPI00143E74C1|nr:GNAT family N-acetyltransferase [Nocardioides sp. JQ2195]QIX28506.1 GNAT family N-acetyltransferase [Nocardioides sp. JQ2195]
MSRRTVPLTLDNLDGLPSGCRRCLFWELDPVRRQRLDDDESVEQKQAWLSEVLRDWGSCGRVALVDDEPVGHVVWAPTRYVPGASNFPTAPVSPDAVLLTTAYVDPEWRGHGIGRLLIQGLAKDLIKRGDVQAVEAFASTRSGPFGHCVVPQGFLASVGFKTHRTHPVHPRMRMEIRSMLTWKDEVELAIERVLGVVRPKSPAPKAAPGGLPPARSGLGRSGLGR